MKRILLVTLVSAGAIAAFGVPSTALGDRPRCFGEPATHVFGKNIHDGNGTNGDDVIVSKAALTFGLGGDDLICGSGRDVQELYGDEGKDKINGRGGEDAIDAGTQNDFAKGGRGDDFIAGRDGNDELLGNGGRDTVWGGAGQDRCDGEKERACEQ